MLRIAPSAARLSTGIAAVNVLLPPLNKRDLRHPCAKYIGLSAAPLAITASLASGVAMPLEQLTHAGWSGQCRWISSLFRR